MVDFKLKVEDEFRMAVRKAGKLGQFDTSEIDRAEEKANKAGKDLALDLYRKTVRTWNTPTHFTARKLKSGYAIYVDNPVYKYIDFGTKRRIATMVPGFKAKTKPGTLYSYQGYGHVAYINPNKPRRRIAKRRFTELIEPKVEAKIHQVFREELHTVYPK
jgi:hypothetical protein